MPKKSKTPNRDEVVKRLRTLRPTVKEKIEAFLSQHPDIRADANEIEDERKVPCLDIDMNYIHREGKDDNRELVAGAKVCRHPLTNAELGVLGTFVQSLANEIPDFDSPILLPELFGSYTYRLYLTGTAPPKQ